MAKPKVFNSIIGSCQDSNIDKVCKAWSTNLYYESQGSQASSEAILRSIQGTSVVCELPEGRCRGLYRVSRGRNGYPVLYGVWGSHCYMIAQVTPSVFQPYEIGRVSNAYTEIVSMTETNGYGDAHPRLIVADGSQVFAVDVTLTPIAQKNDWHALALPYSSGSSTDFIKPSHVAYLYGYLAVLDQGTDSFVLSCQYPFEDTTWGDDIFMVHGTKGNPQGFKVYSEWSPDTTRALIGVGSYLYTFGDRSYQCFSYHDDLNYPFQSPDTAAGAIGIQAFRSVAAVGQQVFWLGSSDIGQNGIFMMEGTKATRISTNDIEREISYMTNPSDAIAQVWQENRHVFYALTFRADKRTFVYDVSEGLWSVRSSYDSSMPQQESNWRPQFATLAYDKLMFATLTDNKLICLDPNKWTEYDGLQIVRRRRSGVAIADYSPFYCESLKLVVNNGQVNDPELNPKVMLRWSWDGSTWSDQEMATCGPIGRYDWNTQWWTLGYGEILTVEITCSDPYDFTIINAKLQVEPSCVL